MREVLASGVLVRFVGIPRGLGLATATTSAAFFRHCEQRSRGARALSVVAQPTKRAQLSLHGFRIPS
jgi:hypothetical protein